MSTQYEPKNHIVPVDIAPRSEGVFDQREITIQSYQTTIPFDYEALRNGFEAAWLSPQTRFGVFAQTSLDDTESFNVVLGLQDELSVRAYDYDERRPLWFSWQNVIVDTVNIRYFRDVDGFLRFKTTGGGRRITDDRLHEFNAAFLTRHSRNQTGCSCTRQSADELPTQFPPSGMSSYKIKSCQFCAAFH